MSWSVENEGGEFRVVVTKDLPGGRWRQVLRDAGCEIVSSSSNSVLSIDEIREAMGERCDGAIGQLTEPWGAELFEALAEARDAMIQHCLFLVARHLSHWPGRFDRRGYACVDRGGVCQGNPERDLSGVLVSHGKVGVRLLRFVGQVVWISVLQHVSRLLFDPAKGAHLPLVS